MTTHHYAAPLDMRDLPTLMRTMAGDIEAAREERFPADGIWGMTIRLTAIAKLCAELGAAIIGEAEALGYKVNVREL